MRHAGAGGVRGLVGNSRMRLLQPRMGRLPDGVHYAVRSNNIPLMPFSENFIYCFLISFLSESWNSWFRTLNSASKKWVSLAASCKAGEAGSSFTRSPFPLWKKSQAKQVTLSPELCYLGGGLMQAKSSCFSIHSNFSLFFFFSPTECWNFSCWKPGLPQKLSCPSVGNCPSQCSPGAPAHCQEGLELVHRLLQGPQLVLRSVSLLPNTWVGKSRSGSLDIWC